jgi:hypothetical protein
LASTFVELAEVSMLRGHSELSVTVDFLRAPTEKQTAARAARRLAKEFGAGDPA